MQRIEICCSGSGYDAKRAMERCIMGHWTRRHPAEYKHILINLSNDSS